MRGCPEWTAGGQKGCLPQEAPAEPPEEAAAAKLNLALTAVRCPSFWPYAHLVLQDVTEQVAFLLAFPFSLHLYFLVSCTECSVTVAAFSVSFTPGHLHPA